MPKKRIAHGVVRVVIAAPKYPDMSYVAQSTNTTAIHWFGYKYFWEHPKLPSDHTECYADFIHVYYIKEILDE